MNFFELVNIHDNSAKLYNTKLNEYNLNLNYIGVGISDKSFKNIIIIYNNE